MEIKIKINININKITKNKSKHKNGGKINNKIIVNIEIKYL